MRSRGLRRAEEELSAWSGRTTPDVGRLGEEYDAVNRRMVGNFPQAFSHIGLLAAARALTDVS